MRTRRSEVDTRRGAVDGARLILGLLGRLHRTVLPLLIVVRGHHLLLLGLLIERLHRRFLLVVGALDARLDGVGGGHEGREGQAVGGAQEVRRGWKKRGRRREGACAREGARRQPWPRRAARGEDDRRSGRNKPMHGEEMGEDKICISCWR